MNKQFFTYFFYLLFFTQFALAKTTIHVVLSDDYRPFSQGGGKKVMGIVPDILREIFNGSSEYEISILGVPWSRAQVMAEQNKANAIITIPTNERLKIFNRGKEKFLLTQMRAFTSKGNKNFGQFIEAKKIEDFKAFLICEYNSSGWAKANLLNILPKISLTSKLQTKIKMVANDRCDLGFENEVILKKYAKELGVSDNILIIESISWPVEFTFLINKNFSDQNILKYIDKRIIELNQSGKVQKILKKWTN